MPQERFNNVTIQLIGDDQSAVDSALVSRSGFLQYATSFNLARVIGQAAEEVTKDESLGRLWRDVHPKAGSYEFELATVLPYYLPTFAGKPEAAVSVGGSELILSSRMLRCFYARPDKKVDPLEYFLVHRAGFNHLVDSQKLVNVHPVPLRTFVTKRFSCRSDTAEEAIQNHLIGWMEELLSQVASLIDSVRAASPPEVKHLFPHLARPSFPLFWLLVEGDNARASAQFCGDLAQHAFRPVNDLDQAAVDALQQYLSGEKHVPVYRAALSLARTYVHYGSLELAVLHVCMACEAVLGKLYKGFLLARGVSKSKYKEAESEIRFSDLLNLHLYSACDVKKLPDHDNVIGTINWARRIRNTIVHPGENVVSLERSNVLEAIDAADRLILFLSDQGSLRD